MGLFEKGVFDREGSSDNTFLELLKGKWSVTERERLDDIQVSGQQAPGVFCLSLPPQC